MYVVLVQKEQLLRLSRTEHKDLQEPQIQNMIKITYQDTSLILKPFIPCSVLFVCMIFYTLLSLDWYHFQNYHLCKLESTTVNQLYTFMQKAYSYEAKGV